MHLVEKRLLTLLPEDEDSTEAGFLLMMWRLTGELLVSDSWARKPIAGVKRPIFGDTSHILRDAPSLKSQSVCASAGVHDLFVKV